MAAQQPNSQPSRALGGILFPVFFSAGDILRARLATLTLPLPNAPAVEAARSFAESRTASITSAICQILTALGLFAGAGSLAERRARVLPRPIAWLGIGLAIPAVLSLLSLALYPANALILLGRLLDFIWWIAAGIALARVARHAPTAGTNEVSHVFAQ